MKYLSFSELRQKVGGRGRTTIYEDVAKERLPAPIKLGGRLYWIESEVDEALIQQREAKCATSGKTPAFLKKPEAK